MTNTIAAISISKILKKAGNGVVSTKFNRRIYSSVAAAAAAGVTDADTSVSQTTPSFTTSLSSPSEKRRGSGLSKWLLFLPGAITFGLGTWQIFRRDQKIKMLDYRRHRLELEPINFNRISSSLDQLDELEFRRVVCNGVFDERKSIYVGPRSRSISGVTENGYYVITPLMPIPNNPDCVQSPILVNRGWVPRDWKKKSLEGPGDLESTSGDASSLSAQSKEHSPWWKFWSKPLKTVQNETPSQTPVEVVGVIRGSEKPSIFVPENDPSSYQWFYVDVGAIARACGLPENTVYVEDVHENVNPSNPYPLPKDAGSLIHFSVMPQDHLNYTLTWYSLSAAVTFMAFKRIRPKKSRS